MPNRVTTKSKRRNRALVALLACAALGVQCHDISSHGGASGEPVRVMSGVLTFTTTHFSQFALFGEGQHKVYMPLVHR